MKRKRKPLTEEQYDKLCTTDGWKLNEVPAENWEKIPGLIRLEDTVAIMASGTVSDPRILNTIHAIAGFDVLVYESHPMVHKAEPEGNAYHYVIQKINYDRYPYLIYGPYRSETRVDHWFEADDLDLYWKDESS